MKLDNKQLKLVCRLLDDEEVQCLGGVVVSSVLYDTAVERPPERSYWSRDPGEIGWKPERAGEDDPKQKGQKMQRP